MANFGTHITVASLKRGGEFVDACCITGGVPFVIFAVGENTVGRDFALCAKHVGDFAEPKLGDDWVGRTENRSGEMHLGLGYGYGGYVVTDVAANDVPGSVGTYSWGGTASTYFFVDRQEQLIGLFLTQLTPSDSYPLRAQFRGLVYQALED